MSQCSQCNKMTSQVIVLKAKDGVKAVFCLKCALSEPLIRIPMEEKRFSSSFEGSVMGTKLPGLSTKKSQDLIELNTKLGEIGTSLFGSKDYGDILGIPTFVENCSLCHKVFKDGESWFSPDIKTSASGPVSIKICRECRDRKTVHSLLETLEEIVRKIRAEPTELFVEDKEFGLKFNEFSKALEIETQAKTIDKNKVNELCESYFDLAVRWNMSKLEQMKEWPTRYEVLMQRSKRDEDMRRLLLRAIEVAESISVIAEDSVRTQVHDVESHDIQGKIAILAVQLAEILWSRKKREAMVDELKN